MTVKNLEQIKGEITDEEVERLNQIFEPMTPSQRLSNLYQVFPKEEVMATSSFAATSALLLKLISEANPEQVIHFIDTGYHFPETLSYRDKLKSLYGLNIENAKAERWKHEWTISDETWRKDPDFCCSINKVEPLEGIKKQNRVWISGLMKWQSDHRASLNIFEKRGGIVKFYPLLDVTREERDKYIRENDLPFHPLVAKGYNSIGCKHCTVPGEDRNGRWNNHPKTECGLHL